MRPLAMADESTTLCAREGTLYSAAYFAAPVTFARPSMREVGRPRRLLKLIAFSRSSDPLVRLRLRFTGCRLGERTHDGAAGDLDLEIVVTEAARITQHRVG